MNSIPPSAIARFWRYVEKTPHCWLWTAGCMKTDYGHFALTHSKTVKTHRFAYELLVGPIPTNYVIDHLCGNRRCCNPAHLEAVTIAENNRRKWHDSHQDTTVPYIPPMKTTPRERFMAKVIKQPDGCWGWSASLDPKGYACFSYNGKVRKAYRYIYEEMHGPIPKGMVVDHICRNRGCVNPAHLRLLSPSENTRIGISFSAVNARKTHCPKGHPLSGPNLRLKNGKHRECRTCVTERERSVVNLAYAAKRTRLYHLVTRKLMPALLAANPWLLD